MLMMTDSIAAVSHGTQLVEPIEHESRARAVCDAALARVRRAHVERELGTCNTTRKEIMAAS